MFRAYQRPSEEWLDCEYRDGPQADRRCHRRSLLGLARIIEPASKLDILVKPAHVIVPAFG